MTKEKISILVLTHNNLKNERKCFEGLKKLSEREDVLEIIILDNNSKDGTPEYIKRDFQGIAKINLIFSPENLGCAGGRKALSEIARGNLVLFLDADAQIKSLDFMQKMLDVLENPEIGMVGLHGYILDKTKMEFLEMPANFHGPVDFVSGFCQMFKKDIISKGCKIDCFYNPYFAEDADFCYQIKNLGMDIFAIPEDNSGIIHKWSATNINSDQENRKKLKYLFEKFDLRPLQNPKQTNKTDSPAIPKIIHQTWKTKDMPYSIYKKQWIDSWLKYNPEWQYKLWTDQENQKFIKENYPWFSEVYDSYPTAIQKADSIRYFLLFHFGGLYVDLDFECLKNIEALMQNNELVFGRLNNKKNFPDSIPNAFMASTKANKFWLEIFKQLVKNKNKNTVEESTGSTLLTKNVEKLCLKKEKFRASIITSKFVYPIDWTEKSLHQGTISEETTKDPKRIYPDAFAITYWTHGWHDLTKNGKKLKNIFETIYKKNIWQYGSGSGSLPENTVEYRKFLQNFLKEKHIKSVVDVGCGDWQFSKLIDWSGIGYTGFDVVKTVIKKNIEKYARENIKFEQKNILIDKLPNADLLIIKDVLQHLSFANIFLIIEKIRKFKYVIIMNGFAEKNTDCEDGQYRPLNLLKEPFNINGKEVFRCKERNEEKKAILLSYEQ